MPEIQINTYLVIKPVIFVTFDSFISCNNLICNLKSCDNNLLTWQSLTCFNECPVSKTEPASAPAPAPGPAPPVVEVPRIGKKLEWL